MDPRELGGRLPEGGLWENSHGPWYRVGKRENHLAETDLKKIISN